VEEIQARNAIIETKSGPVDWIHKHFWIPELKGPMILEPYHQLALNEATRKNPDGTYVYSTVVWGDVKKSIKSCIAAAQALHRGFGLDWGSVIVVANDLKGADSRVGYYMRRALTLNPMMRAVCQVRNYKIDLPNHSFIESVAIDPTGEAGSNADLIIFSELWGAHEEAQKRMWTEMTLPPNKFGYSQRWVETYAGYSGESELLEQLYDQGVKQGRVLDLGMPGLECYANDAARLFVMWNTHPRCPWQTPEYYAQEAAVLPPNEFRRVHQNQWVSSTESFVPYEWWDSCAGRLPALEEDEPMIFALDAGVSSDCFAIVGVTRRGTKVFVRYARAWVPRLGMKLDFAPIEEEIRTLAKRYNVIEWAYDEYQLHDMAKRLTRDAVGWFRPFSQARDRQVADKNLYDLIRERRILHPNNPELNDHIRNANAETDREKMRLVKRSELLKIDLAVALSMAASEGVRLNVG